MVNGNPNIWRGKTVRNTNQKHGGNITVLGVNGKSVSVFLNISEELLEVVTFFALICAGINMLPDLIILLGVVDINTTVVLIGDNNAPLPGKEIIIFANIVALRNICRFIINDHIIFSITALRQTICLISLLYALNAIRLLIVNSGKTIPILWAIGIFPKASLLSVASVAGNSTPALRLPKYA